MEERVKEASVTDSAEAAVKGCSNTAAGEEKPEGYTQLQEAKEEVWQAEIVLEGRRRDSILWFSHHILSSGLEQAPIFFSKVFFLLLINNPLLL